MPYFDRLRHASVFHDRAPIVARPIDAAMTVHAPAYAMTMRRPRHWPETYVYRLVEPDGHRMRPDRLAEHGIVGPAIGQLQRPGYLDVEGGRVVIDQASEPRRGQVVAFVMDTGMCDAAFELADGADLLVIESTFLSTEEDLAAEAGHLTVAQAGRVAAEFPCFGGSRRNMEP